jgi:iron complex outermembrane receptor protein
MHRNASLRSCGHATMLDVVGHRLRRAERAVAKQIKKSTGAKMLVAICRSVRHVYTGVFAVTIVGVALVLVSTSTPAQTQQSTTQGFAGLQEVIVTATKREENVYDVPVSMTVFSADDISRNRIVTPDDFAVRVPGLTYIPYGSNEAYFSMRGIELDDDSSGEDQPVVLFVDDIAAASISDAQPADLYDIDRVEVLKGPQGTLFGRNALGGVISIYTHNPTFQTEGTSEVTYGKYNLAEFKGMFNTPLIDDVLAGRLVVTEHHSDGYVDNITNGNHIGGRDRQTARGKLLFEPAKNVKNVFQFDLLHERGTPDSTIWAQGNFRPSLFPTLAYGPWVTSESYDGTIKRNIWGLTDRLDVTTAVGTITSITGYRHLSTSVTQQDFGDPTSMWVPTIAGHDTQFSEELRLASPSDQKLTWLAGLYYLQSRKERPITIDANLVPGTAFYFFPTVPQYTAYIRQNTTTSSPAVFGEATYALSSKVALTAGARYTNDHKDGSTYVNPANLLGGPAISANYSHSWDAVTPKITLTYKPISPLMTYATVSRGYQSGGYNVNASTSAGLQTPFAPEYVWNYELGTKFDGLDHRLQASLAAFYAKYTDLQIIEFNIQTNTTITENAASSTAKGAEFDIHYLVAPFVTASVAYSYLDGRFTNYVVSNGPGAPPTILTGTQLPYSPTNSLTVSLETFFNIPGDHGRVTIGADDTWRSTVALDPGTLEPQFIRSLTSVNGLVNAHANWYSRSDRWEVSFWAKNVTKIQWATWGAEITPFLASVAESNNPNNHIFELQPNPPPTFGVSVSMKF